MVGKSVPLSFLLLCLLVACGEKKTSNPVSDNKTGTEKPLGILVLNISVAPLHPVLAKTVAVQAMDSVKVLVYSSSGSKVADQRLTLNGTRWQGNINVAAQNNMRVVLGYFGASTVRYLGEKTGVNVVAGGTAAVDITVNYMGLSVTAPDSAGVDFKIRWSSRPLVSGYQIQQDTKADFSTATQIYSGTDTTYTVPISGKTTGQTYYFRARVNTAYGYGPWYSKGGASTVGNIFGTIIIDAPDLPDEVERIVYISNGNVCTINSDGTEKKTLTNITDGELLYPSWSTDGLKILYTYELEYKAAKSEIYSMAFDGTNTIKLTNNSYLDTDASMSPDGFDIAYISAPSGMTYIYVMNSDGTNQKRLFNSGLTYEINPSWFPDGSKIIFSDAHKIYIVNRDGSNLKQLTNGTSDQNPAVSPDGTLIAFDSDRSGGRHIFIMDTDGSNIQQLSKGSDDRDPSWSRNNKQIVFTSYRETQGIYLIDVATKQEKILMNNGLLPSFAP